MHVLSLVNEGLGGGVLRVAIEQSRNMRALGHKTLLVTGFNIPYQSEFFGDQVFGYSKFSVPLPKSLLRYFGGLTRELIGQLGEVKLPTSFKPRWIISHNLSFSSDHVRLAKKLESKSAVVIHNPTYPPSIINYVLGFKNVRLKKYLEMSSALLRKADLVLAIHDYNVRLVREMYGVDAKSIPLGCNPLQEVPTYRRDYLLVASRLSFGKQVHKIAEVISLADRKAKVIFAGAIHPTTKKVLSLIRKTGLKNYRVLFNVPNNLFGKLFLGCRAAVYGLSETDFMMPACHGAPIICLGLKYASDAFTNGIHGYVIENGKGESFPDEEYANCIANLLADERKAWRMGYASWKLCRERYTWLHHSKRLLGLFKSVA